MGDLAIRLRLKSFMAWEMVRYPGGVRLYGKNELLRRVVRVEPPEDIDVQKKLKQRIRDLERALADAKMKEVAAEVYLGVACDKFGVQDVEAFKKKHRWEDGSPGSSVFSAWG